MVIGSVGNLNHEKGHKYLLEAARKIVMQNENVKFLIIGDGTLRGELENIAAEYGLKKNVILDMIVNERPLLIEL